MLALIDGNTADETAARALRSIADTAIAARFRCWLGASGRRYTVSVFAHDASAPDRGLPDFDGCVVIPVCRGDASGTAAAVGAFRVEDVRDAGRVRAAGIAAGVTEWHVHLLAEDEASRRAAVADLARRLG